MAILKPLAHINEWIGQVGCDWEKTSRRGMSNFFQNIGLDTQRYYPVGISIFREGGELISVYAVEANGVDEARRQGRLFGELRATRFLPRATTAQLLCHMQRFSLALRNNLLEAGDLPITYDEDATIKLPT